MAKLGNKTAVAAASGRLGGYAVGALALALLATAFAGDALAQQKGEADQPFGDLIVDAIDVCGWIVDDAADIEDRIVEEGWTVDDVYENGAYVREISASRFVGETEGYIYSLMEYYPEVTLGFCAVDYYTSASVNLNTVLENYAVDGEFVTDEQGYLHGAWQSVEGGHYYLLLAHYEEANDYLYVQLSRFGPVPGAEDTAPDTTVEAPPPAAK